VSLHDAFLVSWVVEDGSLISMVGKDPRIDGLGYFDIREFGVCVSRLSLWTTPDLSPCVPCIYDQELV
jgi:hypothetical protein